MTRLVTATLVIVFSICLLPTHAAEENPHGIGIGMSGSMLGDGLNGESTVDSPEYSGLAIFGKFGSTWGLYFSYRNMSGEDLDYTELNDARENLLPQLRVDRESAMRAESSFKALEFSVYRTWWADKRLRPHAKAGWIFGDFDMDFWPLAGGDEELQISEGLEELEITGRLERDTRDWNSPLVGFGFELGSPKYAFFFDASAYELGAREYDIFYDQEEDSWFWRTEEADTLNIDVTVGFMFKFY